jgi:hypothetical protein
MKSGLTAASRGFGEIIIALGIVSVLAILSLISTFSSSLKNNRVVLVLDRYEAFYVNEVGVWHA